MEEQNCNIELFIYTWKIEKEQSYYSSLLIYGVLEEKNNTWTWSVNNALCTRFGVRINKFKKSSLSYILRKLFEINKLPRDLVYTHIPSNQYLQSFKPNGNKNKELGQELLDHLETLKNKDELITYLIEELKKIPKD